MENTHLLSSHFRATSCCFSSYADQLQKYLWRAIAWLWFQKSHFLLHPVLSGFSTFFSPQTSVLNQSVSFPYLVLFWLHKHHLPLLFSFSTLRLLPPPYCHEPSDNFLQQLAFFATVIGSKVSRVAYFSLPVKSGLTLCFTHCYLTISLSEWWEENGRYFKCLL